MNLLARILYAAAFVVFNLFVALFVLGYLIVAATVGVVRWCRQSWQRSVMHRPRSDAASAR